MGAPPFMQRSHRFHNESPPEYSEKQRNFADDDDKLTYSPLHCGCCDHKSPSTARSFYTNTRFLSAVILMQILISAAFTVISKQVRAKHPFIVERQASGLSNITTDEVVRDGANADDHARHVEAAKCMSDPSCMHHKWRNSFNASVLQQVAVDDDTRSPGGDGTVTIAHCMVGQLRSWTLPTVHEHFREHVVNSPHLPFARHDIYFIVGTAQQVPKVSLAQAEYSLTDLNIMALVQSREPGGSMYQGQRLLECLELLEDTERAVGRRYDFVMRNRPDLIWHQPLPAEALADRKAISNNYDIVGVCPRDAVSAAWPCDVPNGRMGNEAPGYRPIWNVNLYPVSFKRLDDTVERVEMQLEWTYYYAGSLARWVPSSDVTAGRALSCIMNFFAAGCNSYDRMKMETLSRTMLDDFVPTVAHQKPWTADQTKEHSAFRVYAELRAALIANPDSTVPQSVVDILNRLESEYRSGTRGAPMQADGSFAHLEAQCGGRRKYCRASAAYTIQSQAGASQSTSDDPDLVRQYFLELCTRTFELPISARAYYYHPPAMHYDFDVTAAHSGAC